VIILFRSHTVGLISPAMYLVVSNVKLEITI